MVFRQIVATSFALALSVGAAPAKTLTSEYSATSAAVGSGSGNSMFLKRGLGFKVRKKFDFDPSGVLSLYDDGTATLTGRVVSKRNPDAYFDLVFNYDNTFLTSPVFKSQKGSVATGDTFFRDLEGGTLIGGGVLAGLDMSVTRARSDGRFATQFGSGTETKRGANNKNANFGMASWFKFSVDQALCRICGNKAISKRAAGGPVWGNLKLDLDPMQSFEPDPAIQPAVFTAAVEDPAPVPLPAGGFLLIGGLTSLAALRRRKRRAA